MKTTCDRTLNLRLEDEFEPTEVAIRKDARTSLDSGTWARRKVEESIEEFAKGVWKRANIDWVIGEVHFAVDKMYVPATEILGMISKLESAASEEERKRLSELRSRLKF